MYLLYCIFHSFENDEPDTLSGVNERHVYLIASMGLSAAISEIEQPDLAPNVPQALAYEKVIESFYRDRTVIPMRYGCLFDEEAQIKKLLEDRREHCEALLKDLDGLVEIGIRILIPKPETGAQHGERKSMPLSTSPSSSERRAGSRKCSAEDGASIGPNPLPGSGHAYLSARRERYMETDRLAGEQDILVEKICGPLSGLSVRSKKESRVLAGNCLVSIYHLVPRDSVAEFRKAFQSVRLNEPAKLLLSGPWPPYNFVRPDVSQAHGRMFMEGVAIRE